MYAVGDRLGDFQIERIEENQVWLRGPDGLASLAFKNAPPEAGSKTRQATANPPRSAEKSAGTSPTD